MNPASEPKPPRLCFHPAWAVGLGVSLFLNLALLVWLLRPASSERLSLMPGLGLLGDGNSSGAGRAAVVDGSMAGLAVAAFPIERLSWIRLAADDPHEFMAKLRAAGVPELVIRDLITAEVATRYAARARAIWQPARRDYWRKRTPEEPTPAQREELAALDRERKDTMRRLLGTTAGERELADTFLLSELDTPTNAAAMPRNLIWHRCGFSATNATQGSKARLHPTQQQNALPASWRCSG